jgi:hypothetical protein
MRDVKLVETAGRVIGRVLEDAAFIFTDLLDAADRPAAGAWQAEGVSLSFKGKACGELRMWVSREFALLAAGNMLGIEAGEAGAAEKGLDALKELLNIIVGNFITEVYGVEPVFDLGLPQRIDLPRLKADLSHPAAVWLQAEGCAVLVVVEIFAQ